MDETLRFEREAWSGWPEVVGRKFERDGSVRRFPGNTVISFVAADSPLGRCAARAQYILGSCDAARRLSFLPPSSYHMTVIPLICEQDREPSKWSSHLDLDCPLDDADALMVDALAPTNLPESIEMRYRGMSARDVIAIELEPTSREILTALSSYRDAVAKATGVRHSDHEDYVFHVTVAYRVQAMDAVESAKFVDALTEAHNELIGQGSFILDSPVLTFFDDMYEFRAGRR